jgi:hypothetical protein
VRRTWSYRFDLDIYVRYIPGEAAIGRRKEQSNDLMSYKEI